MKEIKLTQGKVALVDDEDYEWLNQWKWHYSKDGGGYGGYAARSEHQKRIIMHRLILNVPDGLVTDHRDGNTLNNQRANLRICTNQQNQMNRGAQKNSKSGYKGVSWHKKDQKWRANIKYNRKSMWLGEFNSYQDAILAYNQKAIELFGDFARLNYID